MKVYRATYKSVPNSTTRFSQWFAEREDAVRFMQAARRSGRPCSVQTIQIPEDPAKLLRWLNNNAFIYS